MILIIKALLALSDIIYFIDLDCDHLWLWCPFVPVLAFVLVHFLTCTIKLKAFRKILKTCSICRFTESLLCNPLCDAAVPEACETVSHTQPSSYWRCIGSCSDDYVCKSNTEERNPHALHSFNIPPDSFQLLTRSPGVVYREEKKWETIHDSDSPPTAVWRLRYRLASLVSELSQTCPWIAEATGCDMCHVFLFFFPQLWPTLVVWWISKTEATKAGGR